MKTHSGGKTKIPVGGTILKNTNPAKNILVVTIFQSSPCARDCARHFIDIMGLYSHGVPVIRGGGISCEANKAEVSGSPHSHGLFLRTWQCADMVTYIENLQK